VTKTVLLIAKGQLYPTSSALVYIFLVMSSPYIPFDTVVDAFKGKTYKRGLMQMKLVAIDLQ